MKVILVLLYMLRLLSTVQCQTERGFFSLFFSPVVATPCNSTDGTEGLCVSQYGCRVRRGTATSSCGVFAVCCVVYRTCGHSSSFSPTYFVPQTALKPTTAATSCTLHITPASDMCQVRLRFLTFNISQPEDGVCTHDSFSVLPHTFSTSMPRLCGVNTGQEVYVSFTDRTSPLTLRMLLSNNAAVAGQERSWLIEIEQMRCTDPKRAPAGCLQYHTESKGLIQSFNFAPELPNSYMNNLNYGICFGSNFKFCEMSLDADTFSVSGDGDTALALAGEALCRNDYLFIPSGAPFGQKVYFDRFCGTRLGTPNSTVSNTIITSSLPFRINVVTNKAEQTDGDVNNTGFSIKYRFMEC